LLALLMAAVIGALGRGVSGAQTTVPKPPPLMIESMYGPDLFNHYCASCHGRDGKGHGPGAAALKTSPPDLTRLAAAQGVFPRARVAAAIGGESSVAFLPSHGSREMPVWGPIFRYLDPDHRTTDVRIGNLVDYIESLQVR
jgi:mono/diheme cytochrome c family protein